MPRSPRFRIVVAALALLAAVLGILEHEDLIFQSPADRSADLVADGDCVERLSAVSGTESLFRTGKDDGAAAVLPSWARQAVWHYGSGIEPDRRVAVRWLLQTPLLMMKSSPGFPLRL